MSVNPNLVWASRAALRQAEELLPGKTLEVEVTRAIRAGYKRARLPGMPELPNGQRYVVLAGAIVAVVAKGKAQLTERRAWHVVQLLRIPKDVTAGFPPPQRAIPARRRDMTWSRP